MFYVTRSIANASRCFACCFLVCTLLLAPSDAIGQDGMRRLDEELRRADTEVDRRARESIVLVFLPGIPGSELTQAGKVIWGRNRAVASDLALHDPESQRLAAATVLTAYPAYGLHESDVYGTALKMLSQLSGSFGGLVQIGYDWRFGLDRLADDLDERLRRDPRTNGKELIIVGHSFGGLVAWAWQQRHAADTGAPRVRHIMLLGAPLQGSCEMARTMLEGYQGALDREAPSAKRLLLDWLQKLVRNLLVGELRVAALTFPSAFQVLPQAGLEADEQRALDRTCFQTTVAGKDIPVDVLTSAFWESPDALALVGNDWERVDKKREYFLERVLRAIKAARSFALDLSAPRIPVTYFYSSDFPTTQKILMPGSRSEKAILLPGLGDGRVPFNTALDNCGSERVHRVRVTETHGDLVKSSKFAEEISKLLPRIALAVRGDTFASYWASAPDGVTDERADILNQTAQEIQELIGPAAGLRAFAFARASQSILKMGKERLLETSPEVLKEQHLLDLTKLKRE